MVMVSCNCFGSDHNTVDGSDSQHSYPPLVAAVTTHRDRDIRNDVFASGFRRLENRLDSLEHIPCPTGVHSVPPQQV